MKLSFLPLLQTQRDLYAMPRGMERFREYIKTMTDAETGDLALPLVAMNPMGKDHIPALIDDYIALGAERIAQEAIASATRTIAVASHQFRVQLHKVPPAPRRRHADQEVAVFLRRTSASSSSLIQRLVDIA